MHCACPLHGMVFSVSSQFLNGQLLTLDYGVANGKRNQKDLAKCTKTRVIITHIFTSCFDNLEGYYDSLEQPRYIT